MLTLSNWIYLASLALVLAILGMTQGQSVAAPLLPVRMVVLWEDV
ncbi:hypothetical protein [Paraburkholderia sediminicola]